VQYQHAPLFFECIMLCETNGLRRGDFKLHLLPHATSSQEIGLLVMFFSFGSRVAQGVTSSPLPGLIDV